MNLNPADMTWEAILRLLPEDLSALARSTGAVKRWRVIQSGEQLLWLCLSYANALMSLRTTAAMSVGIGGMKESSVAYRVEHARPFLEQILAHLLTEAETPLHTRALRLVDASTLSVPGSKGTDFRLHTIYVPSHGFSAIQLTNHKGAETFERCVFNKGDVLVADQGLCHAKGLHYVHGRDGSCIVRACLKNIKLLDEQGRPLTPDQILDAADSGQTTIKVLVPYKGHKSLEARLIIRQFSEQKAEANRKELRARASRSRTKVGPLGLRMCGYFVVLTTVPIDQMSDEQVLEAYRLRWQVELLFKRWKSVLHLDELEAKKPELAESFILTKLIEAAILERFGREVQKEYGDRGDSTGDKQEPTQRPAHSIWRLTVVYQEAFRSAVFGAFPIHAEQLGKMLDNMREGKRRRRDTSAKIAEIHRLLNAA
jgi:hypothetical protein